MFKKIFTNEIKKFKGNPRLIDNYNKNKLKDSIDYYGLVDPIIINSKTKEIIGGHQRYDIIKNDYNELFLIELGDISWVFTSDDLDGLDENQEKALNITLNKISGDWDYNKLKLLKKEIELEDAVLNEDLDIKDEIKFNIVFNDDDEFDDFLKILEKLNIKYGDGSLSSTDKIILLIKENIL